LEIGHFAHFCDLDIGLGHTTYRSFIDSILPTYQISFKSEKKFCGWTDGLIEQGLASPSTQYRLYGRQWRKPRKSRKANDKKHSKTDGRT